ncbi:MAG: P-II family nitrogen regulator [Candidatus Omnitrophica bacterium]|nr:P-II family nitrogen regulator [Candidatus Omnitrophota bacterium]
MKKIEAYIQPFMLHKAKEALRLIHIHGMTVIDAKGFGREKDESYPHHAADYAVEFTPKTKIEIICSDAACDNIVETLRKAAHTGRRGDGKIFVYDVVEAVSILSGKQGEEAI